MGVHPGRSRSHRFADPKADDLRRENADASFRRIRVRRCDTRHNVFLTNVPINLKGNSLLLNQGSAGSPHLEEAETS